MNIHWIHCIENFFTVQHFWTTYTCPEKQCLPWNFSLYWLYTFYHSGFLSNLRLPWKTYLTWNSSLYWNIFYHSGFLSNLCLPWNFSLCWIYVLHSGFLNNLRLSWKTECALNSLIECIFFIIQDFWATCACAEKQSWPEIFHCLEMFFIIQEFWATCACPESRLSLKFFTGLKYFLSFRNFEQLALALKTHLPWNFSTRGASAPRHPRRTPMGLWYRGWKHYSLENDNFKTAWISPVSTEWIVLVSFKN